VDRSKNAQIEEPAARERLAHDARDRREQSLGAAQPAPIPARRPIDELRHDPGEVVLGAHVGRILEPDVAHHPLEVPVVGETHDRRNGKLQRKQRRRDAGRDEREDRTRRMIRWHSPNYRRGAEAAIYGENVLTRSRPPKASPQQ
jgi:hypothetical protein